MISYQVVPFPRCWWETTRRRPEGWDLFRVFISPALPPPPPPPTFAGVVLQTVPFPKPWEKRHAPEPWDTFRPFINPGAPPPPPATTNPIVFQQSVPFPREQHWEMRRLDAWTLFRPYWQPPATLVQFDSSLRFWPDDEARRLGPWDYFRPYWTSPGAPPPPPVAPWNAYRTPAPANPIFEPKDEARRVPGWQLFRMYYVPGALPPPPPPPPPPPLWQDPGTLERDIDPDDWEEPRKRKKKKSGTQELNELVDVAFGGGTTIGVEATPEQEARRLEEAEQKRKRRRRRKKALSLLLS